MISSSMLATQLGCLFLCGLFLSPLQANESEAIILFNKADDYFNKKQYVKARELYSKALVIVPEDKIITVNSGQSLLVPYGRSVKRQPVEQTVELFYQPHNRLEQIKSLEKQAALAINKQETTAAEKLPNTESSLPLKLRISSIVDDSNDGILNADESASIDIVVENIGQSTLSGYKLLLSPISKQYTIQETLPLSDIGAQSMVVQRISIEADTQAKVGAVVFDVRVRSPDGRLSGRLPVSIPTGSRLPSHLNVSNIEIVDKNGDERVSSAELIAVKITVENTGKGVAKNSRLSIKPDKNIVMNNQGIKEFNIKKLLPGKSKQLQFAFFINKRFNSGEQIYLNIELAGNDGVLVFDQELVMETVGFGAEAFAYFKPAKVLSTNLLLSDVDENVPVSKHRNDNAVAVVIGNRNYSVRHLPVVKYAYNDSRTIKKYLINTLGYSERNIIYMEDATATRFTETFGSSDDPIGKLYNFVIPGKSDVFIYYSGHGAPDLSRNSAYFVPVDVDPSYISASGYSLATFYKNISQLPARNITVVLDTCFSGNSFGGVLIPKVSPARISVTPLLPDLKNVSVFMSSSQNQLSNWYEDKKHGLYTYFFLKGLSGKADADENGLLTGKELGNYVQTKVPYTARRFIGAEQMPQLSLRTDYVIAKY